MFVVDSRKRYDLFISFHGSQTLASLGIRPQPGLSTVRHLVEELVHPKLARPQRWMPSMFVDSKVRSEHVSDLFKAILQLRGGGLALILLTVEYFESKYCLAELRALLDMAHLQNHPTSSSEAISLRVVSLEPPRDGKSGIDIVLETVRQMRQDDKAYPFVDGLNDFVLQSIAPSICDCTIVADQIVGEVWRYWDDPEICPTLGADAEGSFSDMQRFFEPSERHKVGRALGVLVEPRDEIGDIITKACKAKVISFDNLDLLLRACEVCIDARSSERAIHFFQRKWHSGRWDWSLSAVKQLKHYVSEASNLLGGPHTNRCPEQQRLSLAVNQSRIESFFGALLLHKERYQALQEYVQFHAVDDVLRSRVAVRILFSALDASIQRKALKIVRNVVQIGGKLGTVGSVGRNNYKMITESREEGRKRRKGSEHDQEMHSSK